MYSDKLVVAIKHNGRVLREQGDMVYLPFGAEYSLFIKNLNTVKALVRVSIDGTDATEGTSGLIVEPNSSIDLERFIKGGNLLSGNRFKFIERTAKIEDGPRGIKAEDGLIRIEFEFGVQPAKVEYETIKHVYHEHWPYQRPAIWPTIWSTTTTTTSSPTATTYSSRASSPIRSMAASAEKSEYSVSDNQVFYNQVSGTATFNATSDSYAVPQNASVSQASLTGITVPGSESSQSFSWGSYFPTDGQKHSMVLRLFGKVAGEKVKKPVTVKTQQECPTCGTKNKFGTKFCRECGTGLKLL